MPARSVAAYVFSTYCDNTSTPTSGRRSRISSAARTPSHAVRIEAVDGFVEHQHLGVAQQCGRDAEALAHPQGQGSDAPARRVRQPDRLQDLRHAAARDPVAACQRRQVGVPAASGMQRAGVKERADLPQRVPDPVVRHAADQGGARGGMVEPEDESHRRRFARAVGAEESGDRTGSDIQGQVVDDHPVSVAFAQSVETDHAGQR
ncbi:hypothetical protein GCM10023194_26030 [Planotetraspora phitsanulokensis]|uniref:Uncharacterized protein n=1 Tax=Planotetraspora phitsanulokensis TaxID=575192 RepID=A0A8J3UBU6_9ACTN|nr:hypothetical protein Pph01_69530 [Planotetraspora phitsanulokensis]